MPYHSPGSLAQPHRRRLSSPGLPTRLGGGFVWDDVLLIEHNPAMDDLAQVWRTAWGDFFQQGGAQLSTSGFFRPVPTLMNGLTVAAFGKSPLAFHLGNVLLHLGTCMLGLALLCRLGWSTIGPRRPCSCSRSTRCRPKARLYFLSPRAVRGVRRRALPVVLRPLSADAWTQGALGHGRLPRRAPEKEVAIAPSASSPGSSSPNMTIDVGRTMTMGAAILVYGVPRLVCWTLRPRDASPCRSSPL